MTNRRLIYFADPMCSWCYGFAPVIHEIHTAFPDIPLQIIPGGLLQGGAVKIDLETRLNLISEWKKVEARSGQKFYYDMPLFNSGFEYDTEKPSRALVCMQKLNPRHQLTFLWALQKAFYADGRNITDPGVLRELAEDFGIAGTAFVAHFISNESVAQTQDCFQTSKGLGIQGFPTLLGLHDGQLQRISYGYHPYQDVKHVVDLWLAQDTAAKT